MRRVGLAALLALAVAAPANGADPRHPDWPCQQVKVPELSAASLWAGPPIDDVGEAWRDDPAVRDMVARLAQRRLPLEAAQELAADFIRAGGDARQERAKLVFAGLFATFNRVRSEVIDGIERYTRRQREFAGRIRARTAKLRDLQDQKNADARELDELANQLEWDTRIFEDRRRTINFVCEVPVSIERRLFALARAIQEAME